MTLPELCGQGPVHPTVLILAALVVVKSALNLWMCKTEKVKANSVEELAVTGIASLALLFVSRVIGRKQNENVDSEKGT